MQEIIKLTIWISFVIRTLCSIASMSFSHIENPFLNKVYQWTRFASSAEYMHYQRSMNLSVQKSTIVPSDSKISWNNTFQDQVIIVQQCFITDEKLLLPQTSSETVLNRLRIWKCTGKTCAGIKITSENLMSLNVLVIWFSGKRMCDLDSKFDVVYCLQLWANLCNVLLNSIASSFEVAE